MFWKIVLKKLDQIQENVYTQEFSFTITVGWNPTTVLIISSSIRIFKSSVFNFRMELLFPEV